MSPSQRRPRRRGGSRDTPALRAHIANILRLHVQLGDMKGLRIRTLPVGHVPISKADFVDLHFLHAEEGFLPALLLFR